MSNAPVQQSLRIHLIMDFDLMCVLGGAYNCVKISDTRADEDWEVLYTADLYTNLFISLGHYLCSQHLRVNFVEMQHWTMSEPGTQRGIFSSGITQIIKKKNTLEGLITIQKKPNQTQTPDQTNKLAFQAELREALEKMFSGPCKNNSIFHEWLNKGPLWGKHWYANTGNSRQDGFPGYKILGEKKVGWKKRLLRERDGMRGQIEEKQKPMEEAGTQWSTRRLERERRWRQVKMQRKKRNKIGWDGKHQDTGRVGRQAGVVGG